MDTYNRTPFSHQEPEDTPGVSWLDVMCAWVLAVIIVVITLLA